MLERVCIGISSLMATSRRFSAKFMIVYAVGSPKLHPGSCEEPAFLSESSSRTTITGINLRCDLDSMFWELKRCPDVHEVYTIVRKKSGERTKGTHILISLTGQGIAWLDSIKV